MDLLSFPFVLQTPEEAPANVLRMQESCNSLTGRYGLSLSAEQLHTLSVSRTTALQSTGRIEFGQGVLEKLVYAFCDSPYLTQENYLETLLALQEMFYYYKGETMERLGDNELIDVMRTAFNGKAQGSLDYLADTVLEALCRTLRGGEPDFDTAEEGDPDDDA